MNHPKVYDAQGRALEVGSRVHVDVPYADSLEVVELDGPSTGGLVEVGIRHPVTQTFERFWAEETKNGDFLCSHLLLINDEEKGDASNG